MDGVFWNGMNYFPMQQLHSIGFPNKHSQESPHIFDILDVIPIYQT